MRTLVVLLSLVFLFSSIPAFAEADEIPIKRAIVFAMDSVNALSFRYAIDNGYCPNISWLIDHGAYFENGVSVFPSVSLSSDFSILTGAYPGTHGILGWMWYNRSEERYYSIDGARIWDQREIQKMLDSRNWIEDGTETMFEVVESSGDSYTSALGTYAARGADTSVLESGALQTIASLFTRVSGAESSEGPAQSSLDTIARGDLVELYTTTEGEVANYFTLHWIKRILFEGVVDSLLFFNALTDVIRSREQERSLIYLWISGTDTNGHLAGGRSEAMLRSYQIVDAKIGMVMSLVKALGMENETLFVIAGNHGIKGINEILFDRTGYRDMVGVYGPILDSGLEYMGGNRGIYLPEASPGEIGALARKIIKDRFVDFTMYREGDVITVIGDRGAASIEVRRWGDKVPETEYEYRILEGDDPLGEGDELAHSPFHGLQPEELNEKGPTPIQYPLAIERILGLFCSPNAPDLVITIGGEASGQHGDLGYEESVVPIVFSGPGIERMRSAEPVSIVDIAPTMMKVMGLREPGGCDGRALNIQGGEERYSLPLLPRAYIPLYIPLFRYGVSFFCAVPVLTGVMDLLLLMPRIGRIASIGDIRALLPDPPQYIGTYPAELFRTFVL